MKAPISTPIYVYTVASALFISRLITPHVKVPLQRCMLSIHPNSDAERIVVGKQLQLCCFFIVYIQL